MPAPPLKSTVAKAVQLGSFEPLKTFFLRSLEQRTFFRTDLYGLDSEEVSNARNIFDEQSKRVLIGMRKSDTSFS